MKTKRQIESEIEYFETRILENKTKHSQLFKNAQTEREAFVFMPTHEGFAIHKISEEVGKKMLVAQALKEKAEEESSNKNSVLPIQNVNVSALSALYDKRLEYEYQIESYKEGSKERIEIEAKFNAIYEAECIVKEHSR